MIFGFSRARWHVPLQATGLLLTIGGYVLGHKHGGRTFPASLHGLLASIILALIVSQSVIGTYLKLHINEGTSFRRWMVFAHRLVGMSYIPFGWTQVLLGMLVLANICPVQDDASFTSLAQCAQPYFTGTFIMQYGLYSYLLHLILPRWKGQSPETWDSLILCLIGGLYAPFHQWRLDQTWLGLLLFLGGGIVSFVLSRNGRRTPMPAIVLIGVGIMEMFKSRRNDRGALSLSFGGLLALSGILRALEITLTTKRRASSQTKTPNHITGGTNWSAAVSITLLSAGLVYATSSENLLSFTGIGATNSLTYISFMLGLILALGGFVLLLGHLFRTSGRNANQPTEVHDDEQRGKFVVDDESDDEETSLRGGEAYELQGPARAEDSDDEIR
ncbi:hypothetical protein M408DRAFT_326213 [Serendipita vermifera MAFF 305830]|uniref:Cytochrome b561 domain-containing protein n=1 Tax=Serendipita vermifera MAFF 305830 TaxID=933852 RepID=A0A0C3B9L7_SERVB|nr:hypothetical protein M408DRAFT_326213 [Serendipita vermifera MAFF 305830]